MVFKFNQGIIGLFQICPQLILDICLFVYLLGSPLVAPFGQLFFLGSILKSVNSHTYTHYASEILNNYKITQNDINPFSFTYKLPLIVLHDMEATYSWNGSVHKGLILLITLGPARCIFVLKVWPVTLWSLKSTVAEIMPENISTQFV